MNKLPQATSFLRRNALYLSWAICLAGAALAAFTLEAGATAGISQSWLNRWLAIGPVPLPPLNLNRLNSRRDTQPVLER